MMGCVTNKSKVSEEVVVKGDGNQSSVDPVECDLSSQHNRKSRQIYCGPEKSDSAESKEAENPNPDNPPGSKVTDGENMNENDDKDNKESGITKPGPGSAGDEDCTAVKNDTIPLIPYADESVQQNGPMSDKQTMDTPCGGNVKSVCHSSADSVPSGKSVPCIVRVLLADVPESSSSDSLNTPENPLMGKVIKRPRSLDSADNRRVHQCRPLSYSPGNLKTRHPRSLHSINETPAKVRRERPKSVDLVNMFENKGFDIHVQKLRRLHTQKPQKRSQASADLDPRPRSAESAVKPNQVKCLEEGPNHCFQPSQMQARRTKNKDFKLKEVHYLRQAIGRPRFKFSKCMECFLQRNDQYLEYDPLLNPLAVQPINPWFTDDKSIMDSHCKSAEVPTELRIKKWGLSFEDLLTDALGVHEFDLFLKKEYSQENLRFYQAVKELMVCPQSQVMSIKKDIESQFLTTGAPCEVNIDSKTMEIVNARLKEEKPTNMRYIFQPAVEHIYMLMKKDSYTRFLRSEQYKSMLVTAQTHNNVKKRLFNFGSNKKKTPSPQPRRRGSANSDKDLCGDTDIGGASYHSFSTGNLRELEDKPKKNLRQTASPSVRRRKEDDKVGNGQDSRRKSNLDVPRASGYVGVVTTPDLRKSEAVTPCLALSVPGKTNVVTPWEGES